jgi:23S rRNA pseudouridine2605 synthase
MTRERLQKVIASAGVASRRGAEEMIRAGRVTVEGRPAIIGEQVDPEVEIIKLDGQLLPEAPRAHSYWALNKPAGVVSTVRDRHAFRTVMDLLPPEASASRVYPVGRLDEMSEGLLLLTDDGTWADLLLHPRYEVEREYVVGIEHAITKAQKTALQTGIELEEGSAKVARLEDVTPAEVRQLYALLTPPHRSLRWYRVVLTQGWKRQIRRMFEVIGEPVSRLVRVRVGSFKLADLQPGEVRRLKMYEVRKLAACAHHEDAEE